MVKICWVFVGAQFFFESSRWSIAQAVRIFSCWRPSDWYASVLAMAYHQSRWGNPHLSRGLLHVGPMSHRVVAKWPFLGDYPMFYRWWRSWAQKRCTFAFRNAQMRRKNAVKEDHIEGTVEFAAVSVCTILIFETFKNTPELHPNFWYQNDFVTHLKF